MSNPQQKDEAGRPQAEPAVRVPHSPGSLAAELRALGVEPGMLLMLHCALKPLGFVLGGPAGLYQALAEVCNLDGADARSPRSTVLMPSFDSNNSEPSHWQAPPLHERHWQTVRDHYPAFDPSTTPGVRMGALGEYFRSLPGTLRSSHPHVSWCGRGPLAAELLASHALDYGLGEDSPLGRCYAAGAQVLCLGTMRTTILHLAEHRCDWAGKAVQRNGSAMLVEGQRRWVEYEMLTDENADFEALRQAYRQSGGEWREGPLGDGGARLIPVVSLLDFACQWLPKNRVAGPQT